jgi:hypothetical protein
VGGQAGAGSTWDLLDGRVLRWLLDQDANPKWEGRTDKLTHRPAPEPQPAFDGELDSREVDEALTRLKGHDLIDGERTATTHYALWSRLRVTAPGLIILGQWPDLDRAASVQALTSLLARLAEQADDPDDRTALRRTAGAVGRLGEGIVDSAVESLGGELAS